MVFRNSNLCYNTRHLVFIHFFLVKILYKLFLTYHECVPFLVMDFLSDVIILVAVVADLLWRGVCLFVFVDSSVAVSEVVAGSEMRLDVLGGGEYRCCCVVC
jgi:uncharacterized membrane protein